ncbi:MAG: aminotransferase class V-fold PLP-dependent enzyme [Phycisphaerales bacterium]
MISTQSIVHAAGRATDRRMLSAAGWTLDPCLDFLNHGSYGATPRCVQDVQDELRARAERDPVRYLKVDLEALLDDARAALGRFVNCRGADLAPTPNATYALATVLNCTPLRPGDEILLTDHEYQSLHNELERVCARTGARAVRAAVPFPIRSEDQVVEAVVGAMTDRTRLVFISHVTSATALVFPVDRVVRECHRRGIDVVVDGAHAPGQVPVDVGALRPTYWVCSGHKWLCGPRGSGFMYVRPDKQHLIRPLSLNSRVHKARPDRGLFLRDFDYLGTDDRTAELAVPAAIEMMGRLFAGGWPALMRRNHEVAMAGRGLVCRALEVEAPSPESMVGCMATVPLPDPPAHLMNRRTSYDDALQDALVERHGIVAPVWRWGPANQRVIRISAQVYNTVEQYAKLADALREELRLEWSSFSGG